MNTPPYADIMLNRTGALSIFTYSIPEQLQEVISEGLVVKVPLRNKAAFGVVWHIHHQLPKGVRGIKPIKDIIHPALRLLPYQKELAIWMSDYYLAPLAACVFSFLPILKKPPIVMEHEAWNMKHGTKLTLNKEQNSALDIIKHSAKPVLLHGVTGSGKTEVYLQYAQEVLEAGKHVLILVPEIALTPQTKQRFTERFGDIVQVWHSELSVAERRAAWWNIEQGHKRLVVGSRSALFLPFKDLGFIAIDEEHEKSYYQESTPRYHARSVAEKLSQITKAGLVLGSATPSLETVWNASQHHYDLAKLNTRVSNGPLPESVIVDLRVDKRLKRAALSSVLIDHLQRTLAEKRQAVLLLNRRGSATAIQCSTCSTILMCRNCNIPLTLHFSTKNRSGGSLLCHHCDRTEPYRTLCPVCSAPTLEERGFGTERIEQELTEYVPTARILRMDKDTTSSRESIGQMYHDFADHKYDILLGTQMIAKGWDIPSVDLVGIVLAESGLMLPDFRAAEYTFSLLVQASGRSGRGSSQGKTIIQTYQPDHPLIRSAALHDFGQFAKQELKNRQQFHYPPFTRIIRIVYQHKDERRCENEITALTGQLQKALSQTTAGIVGPAPCFFERIRGKYRYHTIIKFTDVNTLQMLRSTLSALRAPWVVEVDPPQLL